MTDQPDTHLQVTEVAVSVLPEGDINRSNYTLKIAYRGRDRWAVLWGSDCLGADGTWDYEVRPSEREDEWLDAHRFDYDTALRLAVEAAPGIRVNGRTAVEAYRLTHPEADPIHRPVAVEVADQQCQEGDCPDGDMQCSHVTQIQICGICTDQVPDQNGVIPVVAWADCPHASAVPAP